MAIPKRQLSSKVDEKGRTGQAESYEKEARGLVDGYVDLEAEESQGDDYEGNVAGDDMTDEVGEQSTASSGSSGPPHGDFGRTATGRQRPVPTAPSAMLRGEGNGTKRRRPGTGAPNNSPARANMRIPELMADDEGGQPSRRRRRGQVKG